MIGNYVGIGANSVAFFNRGNSKAGIYVAGGQNLIESNVIGFNGGDGVEFDTSDANGNMLEANMIGLDPLGADSPNSGSGIRIQGSAHDNELDTNRVTANGAAGVRITSGQGNHLEFNFIYANIGLGIDLAGAGITANDNDSNAQPADYAKATFLKSATISS